MSKRILCYNPEDFAEALPSVLVNPGTLIAYKQEDENIFQMRPIDITHLLGVE